MALYIGFESISKTIGGKNGYHSMNVQKRNSISVFWFRRDLRLDDNAGLFLALKGSKPVLPIFIFDKNILDTLTDRADRRVSFIYKELEAIHTKLSGQGSGLKTFYSKPLEAFEWLTSHFEIDTVYTNHDYEVYARERDEVIRKYLKNKKINFVSTKDQVIFEKNEVLTSEGAPYTIFTPYSKRWKAAFVPEMAEPFESERLLANLYTYRPEAIHSLTSMNFRETGDFFPAKTVSNSLIEHYDERRNFPAIQGTSHLSVHLRFGTISVRSVVALAWAFNNQWLNELIWREFYMAITWHFPHISQGRSFKPAYDFIRWRNNEKEFAAWCEGKTGYPIVDAGMRELNATGFMHNRVRMIAASFLVKHLLIDWRWGEAYFAEKLLDFDFAANNGGWQWAAGSGCDAAPYFRVFNPILQTEKFDKDHAYIQKWVPEYNDLSYIRSQIVEHGFARARVLEVFKQALAGKERLA